MRSDWTRRRLGAEVEDMGGPLAHHPAGFDNIILGLREPTHPHSGWTDRIFVAAAAAAAAPPLRWPISRVEWCGPGRGGAVHSGGQATEPNEGPRFGHGLTVVGPIFEQIGVDGHTPVVDRAQAEMRM